MWWGKFTAIAGIKGHNTLLTGDKIIRADDKDKKIYKVFSELKLLNKTEFNKLILTQEDKVYFQVI